MGSIPNILCPLMISTFSLGQKSCAYYEKSDKKPQIQSFITQYTVQKGPEVTRGHSRSKSLKKVKNSNFDTF